MSDEIWISAETSCRSHGDMGIDWDERDLPIAPVLAVAEWLRREPCAVCGRQNRGCVIVDHVALYPGDDDDAESLDEYNAPAAF